MSDSDALKIHEAHERAELAHTERALAPISLTMAILAVLAAAISLLGHRAHSEVLLAQTQANFHKAEQVAKGTQQHADTVLTEFVNILNPQNNSQTIALKERFNHEMGRYASEQEQLKAMQQRLDTEGQHARRKANRFDVAELFCQMALVLCSITLLTRQRAFWFAGLSAAALGLVISATAFLVK